MSLKDTSMLPIGPCLLLKNLSTNVTSIAAESKVFRIDGKRLTPYDHEHYDKDNDYVLKTKTCFQKVYVIRREDSCQAMQAAVDAAKKGHLRPFTQPRRRSTGPTTFPLSAFLLQDEKVETKDKKKLLATKSKGSARTKDLKERIKEKLSTKRKADDLIRGDKPKERKLSTSPPILTTSVGAVNNDLNADDDQIHDADLVSATAPNTNNQNSAIAPEPNGTTPAGDRGNVSSAEVHEEPGAVALVTAASASVNPAAGTKSQGSDLPQAAAGKLQSTTPGIQKEDSNPVSNYVHTLDDSGLAINLVPRNTQQQGLLELDHLDMIGGASGGSASTPLKKNTMSVTKFFKNAPPVSSECDDKSEEITALQRKNKRLEHQVEVMGKELEALRLKVDRLEQQNSDLLQTNKDLTKSIALATGAISQKIDSFQGAVSSSHKRCLIADLVFVGAKKLPDGVEVPHDQVYIVDKKKFVQKKELVEIEKKGKTLRKRVIMVALLYYGPSFKDYVLPGASKEVRQDIPNCKVCKEEEIETVHEILGKLSWTSKTGPLPDMETVQRMIGRVASSLRPSKKSKHTKDSNDGKGEVASSGGDLSQGFEDKKLEEEDSGREREEDISQEEVDEVLQISKVMFAVSDSESD